MLEHIKEERKKVTREIREKTLGFLVGALGLVAGLAWNDAIKSLIDYLFPISKDSIPMRFIYAIIITFVVVVGTVIFTKFLHREEEKAEQKN